MAFYEVKVGNILSNGKTASWHFDLETPVPLPFTHLQTVVDAASTEWQTHSARFTADQEMGACSIQGFERQDNCPAEPDAPFCANGKVRFVRRPTTTEVLSSVGTTPGIVSGQSLPPNVALVVTFKTLSPGRRALGRAYTQPPPEGVTNDLGVVSDFADRATAVRETIEAAEGVLLIPAVDRDHVIVSLRYDEQAEVVSYVANERVDTQRKRLSR